MADSVYSYRTPARFPDNIRIGDDDTGDFSTQEYDTALQRHRTQLFASSAIIATWEWGVDGIIRFNGDPLESVGAGLSEDDLAAVNTVSDNIATVTAVSNNLGNIETIAIAIEEGSFDDLEGVVLAAERAETAATASEASAANSGGSATAALTSATSAAASALSAGVSANEAQADATLAGQWAKAPADTEVEPGLKSARAYAQDAQAFARAIAGIPYREQTTASTELARSAVGVPGDEFSAILCTGATNKTITLPADFATTPALDGRPSLVPVRVIRTGAGTVTLAGAGGTSVTSPSVIGEWQGTWHNPVDPPPSTTTPVVRSITVPAGLNRFLFVVAGEVNEEITSHTLTLASSVGTVTVQTADTGPTGNYSIPPTQNAKSWTVALADSASASTNLDLTFTLPNDAISFSYKVWAAKDVAGISGAAGSSTLTATRNHTMTVTATADSLVMVAIFHKGFVLPVTVTGATSVSTAVATGAQSIQDHIIVTGYVSNAAAGATAISSSWVETKQGAVLGICFEAGAGGGSSVTVVGTPLTVGADSWIDLLAASDGRTYYVMHGA